MLSLRSALRAFTFVALVQASALTAKPAATDTAFPYAEPASVGLSSTAIESIADQVRAMVEDEEIVGGELLIIKNRQMVFRQAYGWKDREAGTPLEVDALYCVRSMTKPVMGTAIQMLIDEGRISLDTPVHEILPAFAAPETRAITVEHLLTHTSGLPFTTLRRPLASYADLDAVAAEAAETPLRFLPGQDFQYSDAGSDTLGALAAAITEAPVEEWIEARILEPLGMKDTRPLLGEDPAARVRVPSAYSGGTGAWLKHWGPEDPPIFPLFLASQSLYSTTTDYARFLSLWLDGGRLGARPLLSPEAVARGLAGGRPIPGLPPRVDGRETTYGQQWVVVPSSPDQPETRPFRFGHDGSDGTYAWVWPAQDLMVFFFTQSRGTLAGLTLEAAVERTLVDPQSVRAENATAAASPAMLESVTRDSVSLDSVAGLFWDETNAGAYYVVTVDGKRLRVVRPGRMVAYFKPGDTPDRFVHEAMPQVWFEAIRGTSQSGMALNGSGPTVDALRMQFGGEVEVAPRHVPPTDLPSVATVVASVARGHGLARLADLGMVRLTGTVEIESRGLNGHFERLFDPHRSRDAVDYGTLEEIVVVNGARVWSYTEATGLDVLEGTRRTQARLDHVAARFGDWTKHYATIEVLKRVEAGDNSVLLVRAVPEDGMGVTFFVDEASGTVGRLDALVQVPGIGIIGVQTQFGDFRDVGGMRLPFRTRARFAHPLIGLVTTAVTKAEVGVDAPAGVFDAPKP